MFSITDVDPNDPNELLTVTNTRVSVTNAVNGYLDNGNMNIGVLSDFQSVPVKSMGGVFDRMDQSVGASRMIKNSISNNQLTLSIGRASFEYWNSKIGGAVVSPWSVYFDGNPAIDTASIPFWVCSAMYGSQFDYYQNNAVDSEAIASALYTALGGALVVGAGKVIFGWVPKNTHFKKRRTLRRPPPIHAHNTGKDTWGWACYNHPNDTEPCDHGTTLANNEEDALDVARAANPGFYCEAHFMHQGS